MLYVGDDKYKVYVGSQRLKPAVKALPYDSEVEYLENNGSVSAQTYIDTGIKPNKDIRGITDFQMISASTHGKFYGNNDTYNTATAYFITYQNGLASNGKIGGKYGGTTSYTADGPSTNTLRHTFDFNKNVLSIDGSVMKTYTYTNFTGIGNILLLAMSAGCTGRLYSCKIYDNNVLVRDFIPVRIGQVGYLYDKVSGALFGNAGTGSFVIGNDKPTSYDSEIEYIESTGTQFLNTGISGGTSVEYSLLIEFCDGNSSWAQYYGSSHNERCAPKMFRWDDADYRGQTYAAWYTTSETQFRIGTLNTNSQYLVEYKGGKLYLNESELASPGTLGFGSNNFCIFGYYPEPQYKSKLRLHECKIWKDGTLVRDMIPVRAGQMGYMYDKVSSEFFGNSGTGDFILGNDVN